MAVSVPSCVTLHRGDSPYFKGCTSIYKDLPIINSCRRSKREPDLLVTAALFKVTGL